MAKAKRGIDCILYRNTGNYASPVWVEIDLVSDLSISGSWNMAPSTVRRSRVETGKPTTLGLTVSGKVRFDDDDAGALALYNAFLGAAAIDLLVLDGPNDVSGSKGWRCEWYVNQANEDQGMQTVLFEDFTLTPTDEDHPPTSVLVTAGSPVYSEVEPAD